MMSGTEMTVETRMSSAVCQWLRGRPATAIGAAIARPLRVMDRVRDRDSS